MVYWTWANDIKKFESSLATLNWNKALRLVVINYVTCNSQSESFISVQRSYATLKMDHGTGSDAIKIL